MNGAPLRARTRTRRASWVGPVATVALLAVLGVGIPVAIAAGSGALDIPRNDDWAFLGTLFHWSDTGVLDFNDWGGMTLVGQLALGAPLVALVGHDIAAVSVLTAVVGLGGLLAVAAMGGRLLQPRWGGAFVAATVAVGPLWMGLAPTFMTDVPAFAFAMASLAIGVVALRRDPISVPLIAAALAVGLYGFSIRQYAMVAPVAVVLAGMWACVGTADRRRLRALVVLGAGLVIAAGVFLVWHQGLTGVRHLSPAWPTTGAVADGFTKNAAFFRLAGLLLVPVVVLAGPVRIVRRAWRAHAMVTGLVTAVTGTWLAATAIHSPRTAFVGNYLARDGIGSRQLLSGVRPDLLPNWCFALLVVGASVAAVLLVLTAVPWSVHLGARVRDGRLTPDEPAIAALGLAAFGYAAANAIAIVVGLIIYDRYALPLLAIIGLLVLRAVPPQVNAARRVTWLPVAATFGVIALLGLAYASDSAAFDAARWELAEEVVATGIPAEAVNGGFEWVGYHQLRDRDQPDRGQADRDQPRRDRRFCVALSIRSPGAVAVGVGPNGAGEVVAGRTYSTPLHGPVEIVAVRTGRSCPNAP